MTAEQAYPAVKMLIQQVNPGERQKLETMILVAVESFEKRKVRISENLDKRDRYKIKPKKSTKKAKQ